MKKSNSFLALKMLVVRNLKLFLKDKMAVFFSLLAPIIVLALYVLFLGKIQADRVNNVIGEYGIDSKIINGFINNWMITGVISVSCITVAFNSNTIMVRDREKGNINDVLAAPVKRWVVFASYIISCFLITLFICFCVFLISMIYLACTGGFMMNFLDFVCILGTMILSIMSAAVISVFIVSFIKSESVFTATYGIMSAAIGFLTGSYMPISMFPKPMQYAMGFIPGSYSSGLFRNFFLRGPLQKLTELVNDDALVHELMEQYSVEMEFFGIKVNSAWMSFILVASIVVFVGLLILIYSKKKTNFFLIGKKIKKKKKA